MRAAFQVFLCVPLRELPASAFRLIQKLCAPPRPLDPAKRERRRFAPLRSTLDEHRTMLIRLLAKKINKEGRKAGRMWLHVSFPAFLPSLLKFF
jgi:hypothetical protein